MTDSGVNVTTAENGEGKGKSIVGLAMTLVGLVLSWMGLCGGFPGLLSVVIIIIGMLLTKLEPFQKIAKTCGIIGIVLSGISIIAGFALLVAGFISVL